MTRLKVGCNIQDNDYFQERVEWPDRLPEQVYVQQLNLNVSHKTYVISKENKWQQLSLLHLRKQRLFIFRFSQQLYIPLLIALSLCC